MDPAVARRPMDKIEKFDYTVKRGDSLPEILLRLGVAQGEPDATRLAVSVAKQNGILFDHGEWIRITKTPEGRGGVNPYSQYALLHPGMRIVSDGKTIRIRWPEKVSETQTRPSDAGDTTILSYLKRSLEAMISDPGGYGSPSFNENDFFHAHLITEGDRYGFLFHTKESIKIDKGEKRNFVYWFGASQPYSVEPKEGKVTVWPNDLAAKSVSDSKSISDTIYFHPDFNWLETKRLSPSDEKIPLELTHPKTGKKVQLWLLVPSHVRRLTLP